MAKVIPFPLARRRDLIERQAAWFCEQNHRAAEASLRRQLQIQRETLLRKGVDPERVEQQCREMEDAVRVAARRYGSAV